MVYFVETILYSLLCYLGARIDITDDRTNNKVSATSIRSVIADTITIRKRVYTSSKRATTIRKSADSSPSTAFPISTPKPSTVSISMLIAAIIL